MNPLASFTRRCAICLAACTGIATLQLAPSTARAEAESGGLQAPPAVGAPAGRPFAVGLRVVRLVDPTRTIRLPHGRRAPRTLITYVRYPALGPPRATDMIGATPAKGPFPLVVFAHGFAVTPTIYSRLLESWTRAGYVVAAPVFPLENEHAPGGPDESDLVNEPTDTSFVITQLLAGNAAGAGVFAGLIDPTRVAVAGQSDGGEAALAVAYSRRFADPRVHAAIVLSGAEMSGVGGYRFGRGSCPLLAVQGTADTTNEPRFTYAFFAAAHRPKYLLRLLGARHLPPYTREQPQLALVERVSTAFLDGYLEPRSGALARLPALGNVPRVSALTADP